MVTYYQQSMTTCRHGPMPCHSTRDQVWIQIPWYHNRCNSKLVSSYHQYSCMDHSLWINKRCFSSCCCSSPCEFSWGEQSDVDMTQGDILGTAENSSILGMKARRAVLASICALMMPVGQAMALEQLTQTYCSSSQGFAFSYPESFVIAFDRTSKNIEDGAVVSVGDFKRFITVTVFASHMPVEGNGFLDVETGYDVCIRPIVESETTMGFRVIREEIKDSSGLFDFEYDHSICRGEQIESSGGVLRCLVRVIRVNHCCLCIIYVPININMCPSL